MPQSDRTKKSSVLSKRWTGLKIKVTIENTRYIASFWANPITEAIRYGTRFQEIAQFTCHRPGRYVTKIRVISCSDRHASPDNGKRSRLWASNSGSLEPKAAMLTTKPPSQPRQTMYQTVQ